MKQYFAKLKLFFTEEIWRITSSDTKKHQFFLIQVFRIVALAIRGFLGQDCVRKASGLTYYSLISIVPIVAMAFGIAKGFGFDGMLEQELQKQLAGHQEIVEWIMGFARSYLNSTKGGMIAGVGFALLLWSLMKVLGSIEASFNDIWEINKPRSVIRKFSDYLSLMIIALLFLISSSSMIVFVQREFAESFMGGLAGPVFGFVIPYFLIWFVFTMVLYIMPNTKVKFSSALIGGVLSGTVFQLLQYYYINFQVGMSSYNAIYGSFAAFPLFLFWLNTSWMVVLFGAELAYAAQNVQNYEYEHDSDKVSDFYRKQIIVYIAHFIVKKFDHEEPAPTTAEIAFGLKLPIRLVKESLRKLLKSKVITEVLLDRKGGELGFQPAIDIHRLTLGLIIQKVEMQGTTDFLSERNGSLNKIKEKLMSMSYSEKCTDLNMLVKDL
ncbi:MAG: YihY/virulence factor BrkB family protein [Breznakibacter sp.]